MLIAPIDQPKSLTELALARLREAIVEGDLGLGERISEARLAAALGISKTPVREALARLQNEGLVTISPRRGTFVFMVSGEEVRAISELRLTLEATALRFAIARNGGAFVADLAEVVQGMTAAHTKRDVRRYLRLDSAFHEQFFPHCDNAYLAEAYRLIVAKIAALRTHLSVEPSQIEDSYEEHRAILDAVAAGEPEEAIAVLDLQIQRMVRSFAGRQGTAVRGAVVRPRLEPLAEPAGRASSEPR